MTTIIPPIPGFLFVRHGESADNAKKIRSGGDADPELTENGMRQARGLARELAAGLGERIGGLALITSPLRRTRETARIIAVELGLPPEATQIWEDFRERRLGAWNGLPVDAASQARIRSGAPPPGGETVEVFRARVEKAAREAAALARGDRHPLVVSSRGVGWILGWPDMPNATVFTWTPPPPA